MSELLVLKARALLSRAADATIEPHQRNELLDLALSCHSRMLELGDVDRPAAVELAIVGADLLQTVKRFETPNSTIPEWVDLHEEQCCRYGAIWIHDLLQQRHPLTGRHNERALELLQRLQQLHSEPIPWIATMRSELQELALRADANMQEETKENAPSATGQPLSVYECMWISRAPLQTLKNLGYRLAAQPPGSTTEIAQLIEAAICIRDPVLITTAQSRLGSHPPAEPWRSYLALQLQQASEAARHELREAARQILLHPQLSSNQCPESIWRLLAVLLHDEQDPQIQASLQKLLAAQAHLEQAYYTGVESNLAKILEARNLSNEDATRAAMFYAQCPTSIRRPYAHWADPEAVDHAVLDQLLKRLCKAVHHQQGFSVVRLGDGEGLFLCGRRPDLGGATSNGQRIEERLAAQGYRLEDPEHYQLRRQLTDAVANADWIGIPDVQACLSGPIDFVSVASGLSLMLRPEQWSRVKRRVVAGGCHIHNYLLQAGYYSRTPFNNVQAVIAPSLPRNLRGKKDLIWFRIPGEARLRFDAFGTDAHYPRVFEQTLEAIAQRINPGDLVLVGAGILGKIYCAAVRRRGGIAVDVGSVIDICTGYAGTRGEYRLHPWLDRKAKKAFRQI